MNILVVDDEELVRKSLQRAFASSGHRVLSAEGGKTGLQLWRDHSPDIVMLDVLMPDMTGPEVLDEIMPTSAHVILMSAFKGKYDRDSAKSLGANDFISKPFEDIFQIVKYVENSYEQKRSASHS